jgi:DNA-binding PadR family transcriptional regulator
MEPLGRVELAVLDAVSRGALRSRRTAAQVRALREQPAPEWALHDVLRRCERDGLLRSRRDGFGRRYELTPAGRVKLRADRRFRSALIRVLARSR